MVVVPRQYAGRRTRKYFVSSEEAQSYCDRVQTIGYQEAEIRPTSFYEIVVRRGKGGITQRLPRPTKADFILSLNRILAEAGAPLLNGVQKKALSEVFPRLPRS
jgi:hypothetical protein